MSEANFTATLHLLVVATCPMIEGDLLNKQLCELTRQSVSTVFKQSQTGV